MLLDHVGLILDGVARLLVTAGLLQDVRRQHVADIVRSMRQKALDGTAIRIRIVDPVPLGNEAPSA